MKHIPLIVFAFLCATLSFAKAEPAPIAMPSGDYIVVAIRAASGVHSPAMIDMNYARFIGQRVSFAETCIWLDETPCAQPHFVLPIVEVIDIHDPNLSDAIAWPRGSFDGINHLILSAFSVGLEGGASKLFLMVDERILIVPVANGSINIILEKPLEKNEIALVQESLAYLGLYNGEMNGVMDETLRIAVAEFAETQGAKYRFADPVISENLLYELYAQIMELDCFG